MAIDLIEEVTNAEKTTLNCAAVLVLLAVANHARVSSRTAWPSNELLSKETGLTERGVRKAIVELINKKWVDVHHQNFRRYITLRRDMPRWVRTRDLAAQQAGADTPEGWRQSEIADLELHFRSRMGQRATADANARGLQEFRNVVTSWLLTGHTHASIRRWIDRYAVNPKQWPTGESVWRDFVSDSTFSRLLTFG